MPGERRKTRRQIILCYFSVFCIYFLDQASKLCVRKLILQGSSTPVIDNIFHITLVHNTGAAFGMFREHPQIFIVLSVLAAILVGYFLLLRFHALSSLERTALCFILGGTLGNLTDRILYGYVVDFIDLRIWPVFNVADSFITVGAAALGWSLFAEVGKQRSKEP